MENSNAMSKLRKNLGNILKLLLNEQYQETIPLVNNAIFQCGEIEKSIEKNGEKNKLWQILREKKE